MASFSTNEFKPGLKVILDGDPCSILENEYVKPGKGQAFNRVKLRNLKNGRVWERTFTDWIERPTPESLLNAGIFFDLDGVWGRVEWAARLRELIARKARGNSRFLACMARNALLRTPPLGFFKDFVVESDGRHTGAINI